MKHYRLLTTVFLLIFIGGGLSHFHRESLKQVRETLREDASLRAVLPEAQSFGKKTDPFPYFIGYKTSAQTERDLVGFAFFSTDIDPDVRGFAGPIKILIGMDASGRITNVNVLKHSETSSYIVHLDKFLAQFKAKKIGDDFELGVDIDGISRATITSAAVTRAVGQSLRKAGREILKIEAVSAAHEQKPLPPDQIIVPLLLFIVAVGGALSHNALARWAALTGGLVYFGIMKATMISIVQVVNIGLMKVPSFEQSPLWYMLIGLTLLATLLFGNVFCGSLCPFAAVQEILYNIVHHKERPRKHVIDNAVDQNARYIKYLIVFAVLLVSFILGNSSAAGIEPFLTLFTWEGTTWARALLIAMLIASLFYFRFWCKYFCPAGACLGLLARLSLYKIRLGRECTHCELCDKTCPTRAIHMDKDKLPRIDYPECILCGKCVQICHVEELKTKGAAHE